MIWYFVTNSKGKPPGRCQQQTEYLQSHQLF